MEWLQGLDANAEQARRRADVTTYRSGRLYLAGSAHAFRSG
jgi:cyclopropane fatty-acyl-phospholipid synthase-like methyltransferase